MLRICFFILQEKKRHSRTLENHYIVPFLAETPKNWDIAFDQLKAFLLHKKTKKKQVIFLDEVPWIATAKSGFLSALDYFWNAWAVDRKANPPHRGLPKIL